MNGIWVAGAIWILVGVVFIGAVHDYMALTVSMRHGGRSICDTSRELLGTVHPLFNNRYLASALTVVPAFLLGVTGGWKLLWPLFASSNQMSPRRPSSWPPSGWWVRGGPRSTPWCRR